MSAGPDGTLEALHASAVKIIRLLCLNSPAYVRWRRTWIRVVELAGEHDVKLHRDLLRYPDDLPDLRSRRAQGNLRPEGIDESFFARRERRELSGYYLQ